MDGGKGETAVAFGGSMQVIHPFKQRNPEFCSNCRQRSSISHRDLPGLPIQEGKVSAVEEMVLRAACAGPQGTQGPMFSQLNGAELCYLIPELQILSCPRGGECINYL